MGEGGESLQYLFCNWKTDIRFGSYKSKVIVENVLLQVQMCSAANMNVKLIPIATAAAFQL